MLNRYLYTSVKTNYPVSGRIIVNIQIFFNIWLDMLSGAPLVTNANKD